MTIIEPPMAVVFCAGADRSKEEGPWRRPAPEAPRDRESHYAANFSTVPVLVAAIATNPNAAKLGSTCFCRLRSWLHASVGFLLLPHRWIADDSPEFWIRGPVRLLRPRLTVFRRGSR
jgi:hypothetical protein